MAPPIHRLSAAALALTFLLAIASWQVTSAQSIVSDVCATPSTTVLKANSSTVTRGVFSPNIKPVAHIQSGEIIVGECVTQRGSNDYAKLIKGDPGVEDIFFQATGSNQSRSYNAQAGNGGHILTGPIQVCGAKAGDVLKVEILALDPRKNPATGKCYGANTQGVSGYPAQVTNSSGVNFTDSAIIIYDVISDETGKWGYPVYQFMVPDKVIGPDGKTGGQVYPHPVNYGVPGANGAFDPVTYPEGFKSSLPNGTAMVYTDAPLNFRIPLRPHLGTMGVAPANALDYGKNSTAPVIGASSGPPSNFGGNIDNWRIGAGATIYYKVQVDGGLLSFGDCHAAEGDSELSGNAIEASLTGTFRITNLPAATLPAALKNMKAPIMETKDWILVHGFAYNDYISELAKPSDVGKPQFGADLNKAFANTYFNTRQFLIDGFGLTERESISVMSTSVDFGVTQVVDSNWGAHGIIYKSVFSKKTSPAGGIPLMSSKRKLLDSAAGAAGEEAYPDMLQMMEDARRAADVRAREL